MAREIERNPKCGDAELVGKSLAGDHDAFGRIVGRYQSLICSLAYSATGSVSQSEDLAQDAFVIAWKELRQLREPAKLRSWLCSIARSVISHSSRRRSDHPTPTPEPLDTAQDPPAPGPLPSEAAIGREEEAILWRSIERIPEIYREPLVLFYREHKSIETVAADLDLNEDAVKQRLSRGRKLLHQEVLAFVEGALERTKPGKGFTFGVMAMLPALALSAKAATAGAVLATAKTSSAAKGAGLLGSFAMAAGTLPAAAGGIFAIWGRVRNARSARERKFLVRASWGFLAWVILLEATVAMASSFRGGIIINNFKDALGWSLVWIGTFGPWVAYCIWMARRKRRIQIEDGTLQEGSQTASWYNDPAGQGFRAVVYGGLAAMLFGPGGALLMLLHHRDGLCFGLLSALLAVAWMGCGQAILRRPQRLKTVFFGVWWGLGIVTLAILNLRWHRLVNDPETLWPGSSDQIHPAPAYLTFLIAVFYCSIGLAWWLERHFLAARNFKRDVVIAVAAFLAGMGLGIVLWQLDLI